MKFVKISLIFVLLLALHVELLLVFISSFYLFYFINLLLVSFFLYHYIKNYSLVALALHVAIVLLLINLDIYDEYIFEFLLHFNLLGKLNYINSEVMYLLSAVHLLVFINLKRLGELLGYNKVKTSLGLK